MPCLEADRRDGYRNKCEFTFGLNGKGERSVGFRTGRYKDRTLQVEDARIVPIVTNRMKLALQQCYDLIQKSQFAPYCPASYTGHWNVVMMRQGGSDSDEPEVTDQLPETLSMSIIIKLIS